MSKKYEKILEDIEKDIFSGKYNETKKLPKEEELVNIYNVSRTTVRKAISVLVNKGYVYQVQGSGIFIRENGIKGGYLSLESLKGLTRDYPDKKIETKVLNLELIEASKDIAEKMKCEEGSLVYYLERVRIVDGVPFSIERTYFNKKLIPYLSEEIAKKSIYSYIINDLGLTIGFADKVISADKLSKLDADLFGLEENDPNLVIDGIEFLSTGDVFAVSRSFNNYKVAKLIKLSNF